MSLCLITMYIDINRDKWVYLNRDYKDYFNGFLPFTKFEHDIIIFMDEKHYDEFILLLNSLNICVCCSDFVAVFGMTKVNICMSTALLYFFHISITYF